MPTSNKDISVRVSLSGKDALLYRKVKHPALGISVSLKLLLYSEHAWIFFDNVEELRKEFDSPPEMESPKRQSNTSQNQKKIQQKSTHAETKEEIIFEENTLKPEMVHQQSPQRVIPIMQEQDDNFDFDQNQEAGKETGVKDGW